MVYVWYCISAYFVYSSTTAFLGAVFWKLHDCMQIMTKTNKLSSNMLLEFTFFLLTYNLQENIEKHPWAFKCSDI